MTHDETPDPTPDAERAAAEALATHQLEGLEPSDLARQLLQQLTDGKLTPEEMRERLRQRYAQ
jgi:hypothetical protein